MKGSFLTLSVALGVILLLGTSVAFDTAEREYFEDEVGAWHLHTFLMEVKESSVDEALSFR